MEPATAHGGEYRLGGVSASGDGGWPIGLSRGGDGIAEADVNATRSRQRQSFTSPSPSPSRSTRADDDHVEVNVDDHVGGTGAWRGGHMRDRLPSWCVATTTGISELGAPGICRHAVWIQRVQVPPR